MRIDEQARPAPGGEDVGSDGAVARYLDDAHLAAAGAQLVGKEHAEAALIATRVVGVDGDEALQ